MPLLLELPCISTVTSEWFKMVSLSMADFLAKVNGMLKMLATYGEKMEMSDVIAHRPQCLRTKV